MKQYQHTQNSPLPLLIGSGALVMILLAVFLPGPAEARVILSVVAGLLCLTAAMFAQLTITGDESELRLQYGPLPLIHKRFPYESISSVAASQTRVIDGWGIHYIPTRGWTYNLWGFHCVVLERAGKKPVRIGTDDVNGLLAHLRTKIRTPA